MKSFEDYELTEEEKKYFYEQGRKWHYKQYCNYCIYEDKTKPVSFEEWDKHCDEKGRWVK